MIQTLSSRHTCSFEKLKPHLIFFELRWFAKIVAENLREYVCNYKLYTQIHKRNLKKLYISIQIFGLGDLLGLIRRAISYTISNITNLKTCSVFQGFTKIYFMIDQQIARHFGHYRECLYHSNNYDNSYFMDFSHSR